MNIDKILTELAEASEKPVEVVKIEIDRLLGEGYSERGAILRWKQDNKFQLGAGRAEHVGRLLAIESPRSVVVNDEDLEVMNIHFVVQDIVTNEYLPRKAAVWGTERIDELLKILETGMAYSFKASIRPDNTFNRLTGLTKIADSEFPKISELEPIAMENLLDVVGTEEFVKGWITKIIEVEGMITGFEIADLGTAPPVTIWFGGQYSKISVERQKEIAGFQVDDEVVAYGYISQGTNDLRIYALNILRVD
jgi:hypothetical protein